MENQSGKVSIDTGDSTFLTQAIADAYGRPAEPKLANDPKANKLPTEPRADKLTTEPKANELITEPKADELPTEPKADKLPTEPKADKLTTEPKADKLTTEPKADKLTTEPKADKLTTEPKADKLPTEPTPEPLTKLQTSQLLIASNNSNSDAIEIVNGLVDGAIYRPGRAVKQVLGLSEAAAAPEPASISRSHKTGQVVGSLVPFVGLVGLTRGASAQLLGECCSPPVYRLMGEQATAGFLLGSLLTPSNVKPGEDLLSARLNQGGMSAATFASITGTAMALDRDLPKPDENAGALPSIARRVSISVLSGAVGEFVDVQGRTSFSIPVEESLSSTVSSAAFGSLTDGAGKLVNYFIQQNARRSALGPTTLDAARSILPSQIAKPVVSKDKTTDDAQ